MAFFDLPLRELHTYRPSVRRPADFEGFWRRTLDAELSRALDVRLEVVETPLRTLDVYDVSFAGYGGQRIHAWLRVPAGAHGGLPAVVQYRGYSGGRGYPFVDSLYGSAGYAHFVLDSRGQGWRTPSPVAPTPDLDPAAGDVHVPGLMTLGISSPQTYYYRRLYVDAVRLLQAAGTLDLVDAERIAVAGTSQGGGLSIAAAALATLGEIRVAAALPNVPFLCHFERAVGLTDSDPYREIAVHLAAHPSAHEQVFTTLSYFDGVNLSAWCRVPALFSTALMDTVCPPSTVFAAYHAWAGTDKDITVYPWNGHEGGSDHHAWHTLSWLGERLGSVAAVDSATATGRSSL